MPGVMRSTAWLLILGGAAMIVAAVAQMQVDAPLLGAGLVVAAVGVVLGLGDSDVLADHPDELELRRRRGAAGWQKPVKPPPPGSRPGGLPPRKR